MKTLTNTLTLTLVMLAASGCIVEESVGPQGPPGYDGNANVFTLNFDFFLADAAINGNVASVQYDVLDITRSVVEEGAVLMFFRDQGTWTAMPYTFFKANGSVVSLGFGFDLGFLEVFYETDGSNPAALPDREMKAVIIDGFPAFKAGIDLSDYKAVAEYFGLDK